MTILGPMDNRNGGDPLLKGTQTKREPLNTQALIGMKHIIVVYLCFREAFLTYQILLFCSLSPFLNWLWDTD